MGGDMLWYAARVRPGNRAEPGAAVRRGTREAGKMDSARPGRVPAISIVIAPRDRFSIAPRALRSLLTTTTPPYQLVYVDAGSPADIRDELAAMARVHGFTLIRHDEYGGPNRSRNIGLAEASGEYVVLAENDVLFTPGWLEPLVDCARQTGADVVSPLILMG